MELQLFNTLTRSKELFRPLAPGRVGIYTCGPTVYAPAHIGNLRSYIFPDVLKKTLRRLGYEVHHVINITDVGHLTSDGDTGEDKLERAAREAARSAWEVAAEFTERFLADLRLLGVEIPADLPRATEHVPEQIALIRRLEERGFTYATDDGIYFDTSRFADYGRLARLKAEGLQEGIRVEMGGKRNKTDFALWKFSPPDANRQMEWDSPWGRGFPGWHIECSAMSAKYLGEQFDIHTGGTDHIPVHHTNEIAQSEAATGKPFVRYWLHGEFLVLEAEQRMGKSEGNLVTLQELADEGFQPLAFRYLALNSHYRHFLNFSREALRAAGTSLTGLRRLVRSAGGEGWARSRAKTGASLPEGALAHLCDDLNTPKALASLWTALRDSELPDEEKLARAADADELLSLNLFDFSGLEAGEMVEEVLGEGAGVVAAKIGTDVPEEIRRLARQRWAARLAKDFAESDNLRDRIAAEGYAVKDGKEGYELTKKH